MLLRLSLAADPGLKSQKVTESESEKLLSPKKSKKLAMAYVSLGRDYLQR
jgi:hypothetical protein